MNAAPLPDKSLTLVMDAAEGRLQVGLAGADGRFLFGSVVDAPSRGVEILTHTLESVFTLLDRDIADIARIAVVRGPGSFTGLRLTAATAAGLARAVSARQAGLDYMHCIARQCMPFLGATTPDAQLWVLVRARRDLVYAQAFVQEKWDEVPFHALTDLAVLPVSSGEAAAHIAETATMHKASRVLLAGSGAKENRDLLIPGLSGAESPRLTFLDVTAPWPDTLLAAALGADYGDADIEPLYVRVSDAETNLPHIARRLGLDPDDAVRRLHKLTHSQPDQEA
ncbi:putative Glycoprotease family protein [uncultured delta proteobacterium]|uniref:Putative Glycoprotease family protein n=1 Tax=uncultured delta proteobacterium TaxID=34034 RepID=A0A212JQ20_9DELT|nr:putative Glycoprotease family protein [uncultured delta proteobacterium]